MQLTKEMELKQEFVFVAEYPTFDNLHFFARRSPLILLVHSKFRSIKAYFIDFFTTMQNRRTPIRLK